MCLKERFVYRPMLQTASLPLRDSKSETKGKQNGFLNTSQSSIEIAKGSLDLKYNISQVVVSETAAYNVSA